MTRSVRNGFFSVAGIALVAVGTLLLADRLIAPILRPLQGMLHALGMVAWPLALIGVGAVLITASRSQSTGARLYRSRNDRVIGGVLGGVAARWSLHAGLVRALFIVLALLTSGFAAVVLYVLAMAFLPEEPTGAFAASVAPPSPAAPAPPARPAPPIPSIPAAPSVPESSSAPAVP